MNLCIFFFFLIFVLLLGIKKKKIITIIRKVAERDISAATAGAEGQSRSVLWGGVHDGVDLRGRSRSSSDKALRWWPLGSSSPSSSIAFFLRPLPSLSPGTPSGDCVATTTFATLPRPRRASRTRLRCFLRRSGCQLRTGASPLFFFFFCLVLLLLGKRLCNCVKRLVSEHLDLTLAIDLIRKFRELKF